MKYHDIAVCARFTFNKVALRIRNLFYDAMNTRPRVTREGLVIQPMMLVMALLGVALPPVGAVECGDTLGPGGRFTLEKDIVCSAEPAISVLGHTVFNLNGHTITSSPVDLILIKVEGRNARVFNGFLEDCGRCLIVAGEGHHIISRIVVRVGGASDGILVSSDKNLIYRNAVAEADVGFVIGGEKNIVAYNAADNNFGEGFVINGIKHLLLKNTADENVSSGFVISGSHHRLVRNEVTGTRLEFGGFEIGGDGHTLRANIAMDNAGDGLLVKGAGHRLFRNTVENNGKSGISVAGTNNIIKRNFAQDNGDGVTAFDLRDDDPLCDNNVWKRNTFKTSNTHCIR